MSEKSTRRRLIRAVGVAATATLAGCSSSGGKESSTGTTSDTQTTGTTTTGTGTGTTGTSSTTSTNTTTSETTTEGTTTETTTEETTTETTTEETDTTETTTDTAPPKGGGDVQFTTESGATVRGTLVGDGSCGIVFAHDDGFDRKDWLPHAKKIADKGHPSLLIGLSSNDKSATEDVLAAGRYLRQQVGVDNVVLVGAGTGANTVVRANAQAESGTIAGTLALSPNESDSAVSSMQGWKLFVVAKDDDDEYVQTTKEMYEAASNPKRFEKVVASTHGQHVFEENENAMLSLVNGLLMTVC